MHAAVSGAAKMITRRVTRFYATRKARHGRGMDIAGKRKAANAVDGKRTLKRARAAPGPATRRRTARGRRASKVKVPPARLFKGRGKPGDQVCDEGEPSMEVDVVEDVRPTASNDKEPTAQGLATTTTSRSRRSRIRAKTVSQLANMPTIQHKSKRKSRSKANLRKKYKSKPESEPEEIALETDTTQEGSTAKVTPLNATSQEESQVDENPAQSGTELTSQEQSPEHSRPTRVPIALATAMLSPAEKLTAIRNRRLRQRQARARAASLTIEPLRMDTEPAHMQSKPQPHPCSPRRAPKSVDGTLPPLPTEYSRILRAFRGLETSLNMMMARRPAGADVAALRKAVEAASRVRFDETVLGKIMTVLPEAYRIYYCHEDDTGITSGGAQISRRGDPDIILRIAFGDEVVSKTGATNDSTPAPGHRATWLPEASLRRRLRAFEKSLVKRVASHHSNWLSKHTDMTTEDLDGLPRHWHFEFKDNMDSIVPPLVPAPMPIAPACDSAARRQAVLTVVREPKQEPTAASVARERALLEKHGVKKSLKGISLDLIARVRARDAAKRRDANRGGPELRARAARLAKLPYLIGLLRSVLRSRKRSAMPLTQLVPLLVARHRNQSSPPPPGELVLQIECLADVAPRLCQVRTRTTRRVVRLDMTYSMNRAERSVQERLRAIKDDLRRIEMELAGPRGGV